MAYTQTQLETAFKNAAIGTTPTVAQTLTLQAIATQNATGQLTDAQALSQTINLAANSTTDVSVGAYQFFLGFAPSVAGLTALNAAYTGTGAQVGLNGENRFIAQSVALATQNDTAKAAFAASYGTLTVAQATAAAYNIIIGNPAAIAAGVNVDAAVAYLSSAASVTYYTNFIKANTSLTAAADIELAVKAAIVGEIMFIADGYNNGAGLGSYASATNSLVADLSDDGKLTADNAAGINLLVSYPSSVPSASFTLTTAANNFTGSAATDVYDAALVSVTTPANSTLNVTDVLDGGAGADTLNITTEGVVTNATNSATISNIETINIRVADNSAAFNASTAAGVTVVNANQGAGTLAVTNLATGAAIGVIGNGTVVNGAVTFGYATAAADVTINLSGGTKAGTTITNSAVAGTATTKATINSTGVANTIGALDLDGNTVADLATLVVNATSALTATLVADDYVATGAALTVTGAGKVNLGALGTFKTVDASANSGGLTLTLDTVTTSFKGSSAADTITTATLATPTAGAIDGGAGTDTLVVAAAGDVASAALRGAYTGFEKLSNGTGATIAADGFTGVTSVITSTAGGGFSGLTAAQSASIDVTADLAATGTTYALTTATGTSDVLGLNFKNSTATTVENATALTVTGFETLNLTAASGGKSLYNTAGTAQLTAGTDYDNFALAAGADLTTVTLLGDYAAKISLSATSAKVTTVNASANTAGADIVVGGQTGTVVVTGTESRDVITLNAAGAGGLQTVNAGGGVDSIVAAQATIAVATINGGAGKDTLTVNDAGTVTVNDNNFAGVSAVEALNFSAATALTFSVGGYANAMATANAGLLEITAAALTGVTTIDGTGLSPTNALKLSLTNVDAAANASATTITLSQGADNIVYKAAGALTTDTITINGGVAALAATTAKTIDLSGVTVGGAISVTTGAGADVVKAAAIAGTYVLGAGADTFTGGAGVDTVTGGAGVDTLTGAGGNDVFVFAGVDTDIDTSAGAVTDIITDFVSGSDTLDFTTAGSGANYVEQLTAAADLTALLAAADTALNGTVQYYFGVVGTDGYLVQDVDGLGYTTVLKLTGVTDMAFGDIT